MRFEPKTESELQMANLIPEGTYPFYVKTAEACMSKKGNEMIKVMLAIEVQERGEYILYDYLLEAMAKKLKHFADAIGLKEKYASGELKPEDVVNLSGLVDISIEPGSPKPEGGSYPAKNIVVDYIKNESVEEDQSLNDHIPF